MTLYPHIGDYMPRAISPEKAFLPGWLMFGGVHAGDGNKKRPDPKARSCDSGFCLEKAGYSLFTP
jgi:hypothetical protein